jgi:hypothetical protein
MLIDTINAINAVGAPKNIIRNTVFAAFKEKENLLALLYS